MYNHSREASSRSRYSWLNSPMLWGSSSRPTLTCISRTSSTFCWSTCSLYPVATTWNPADLASFWTVFFLNQV